MAELVAKPREIMDLGPVDVDPLRERVAALGERAWQIEDSRKENDFPCFHDTRHIVFRFIEGNRDPERFYANPAWSLWEPLLMPVMRQAIAPYGFVQPVYPKAMLARLSAGGTIDRHRDGAGSNLRTHKIHVPLFTNPGARLLTGQSEHFLQVGHAYEVNNVDWHGAVNRGEEDRVHFIFEVFDGIAAKGEHAAHSA